MNMTSSEPRSFPTYITFWNLSALNGARLSNSPCSSPWSVVMVATVVSMVGE
jgi:hypothetical protein